MIVREVWEDETLIDQFDYFNDFQDTYDWLGGMASQALKSDDRKCLAKRFD